MALRAGLLDEIVRMAFDTVRNNKMRSGLTVLGVVIGITSIVGMTALIRGFDQSLRDFERRPHRRKPAPAGRVKKLETPASSPNRNSLHFPRKAGLGFVQVEAGKLDHAAGVELDTLQSKDAVRQKLQAIVRASAGVPRLVETGVVKRSQIQ